MSLTLIITGIVYLILLICFFLLCSNISKIRKQLLQTDEVLKDEFAKAEFFGHEEQAKKIAEEMIWKSIPNYRWQSKEYQKQDLDKLKENWKGVIEKYKINLPD